MRRRAAFLGATALIAGSVPIFPTTGSAVGTACGSSGTPTVVSLQDANFYIDSSATPKYDSQYAGYTVRNGTSPRSNVWMKLSGFTGGIVTLGTNELDRQPIGTLAPSAVATNYFVVKASGPTTTVQTHTITLYTGDPSTGGTEICNRTFSYVRVTETIKAASNKITSVSASATNATVGQVVTMTVVGKTGVLGAGPAYDPGILTWSPSVFSTFPATSWRLVKTVVTVSPDGVAAAQTYTDRLQITAASGPDRPYTAVYSFRAMGPLSSSTPVAPTQYIASGTQVKHTEPSTPLPTLPPIGNALLLAKTASVSSQLGGGQVTYTVTMSNTSSGAVAFDSFVDTIPSGTSYVAGSSTVGGVGVTDPSQSGSTLTWAGPYTVPAKVGTTNGTVVLSYKLLLPSSVGLYTNSVVGISGATQIDTTLDGTDNKPGTATVFINANPDAVNDTKTTSINTPTTITVLTNDALAPMTTAGTDPRTLTVSSFTQPSQGTVTFLNGVATYTPNSGFSGVDTFTYTISDGRGGTDTATVTINVGPQANNDSYFLPRKSTITTSLNVLANDLCSTCTITSVGTATNGTATVSGGKIDYTPNAGLASSVTGDTFTYTITDSATGLTSTATVTITFAEAVPDYATTPVNTAVAIAVGANDDCKTIGQKCNVVNGNISVSGGSAVGTTTVSNGGTTNPIVTFTPATGFTGLANFVYQVDTVSSGTGLVSVTDTVLVGPPNASKTIAANTSITGQSVVTQAFLDTCVSPSGRCVFTNTSDVSNGTLTMFSDGTFNYVPDPDWTGIDTFTFRITDSATGLTSTATYTINVTPVAVDDSVSTKKNTAVTIPVLSNDTCFSCTVTLPSSTAPHGTMTVSGNQIIYTPTTGYTGTDTFTYRITDGSGQTTTATVTVTIPTEPPNPTVANDSATTPFNTALSGTVATNDTVQSGGTFTKATDPSNGTVTVNSDGSYTYTPTAGYAGADSFTYTACQPAPYQATCSTATVNVVVGPNAVDDGGATIINTPLSSAVTGNDTYATGSTFAKTGGPSHGAVTLNTDGTYTYTPTTGYTGPDEFTYKVCAPSPNGTLCSTATVYLTVGPTAVDDSATTPADTPKLVDVQANDGCTGCQTSIASDPLHGTVSVSADGKVYYTPFPGYTGTDTFDYVVTDASGGFAIATVTMTVSPTSTDDYTFTPKNTLVNIAVQSNDVCNLCTLTPVSTTTANGGSVTRKSDGTFDYMPASGFAGSDSFTYTLTDPSTGLTTTSTVYITVNDAQPDYDHTPFETAVEIADVQANDPCTSCLITGFTQGINGTVTQSASDDDTFTYTPNSGFSGLDTFTYSLDGGAVTATVTVLVGPETKTFSVEAGASVSGNPLSTTLCPGLQSANDFRCTVTLLSGPASGSLTLNDDGSFSYLSEAAGTGSVTFTYTLTDPVTGLSETGTVIIDITAGSYSLLVTKTASPHTVTEAGNVVTYTIRVENNGLSPVTGITVSDPLLGTVTCPSFTGTLNVGEFIECTGTYTVTESDIAAGSILNTATATGDGSSPGSVTADGSEAVTVAGLSVTKAATSTDFGAVGDPVSFTVTATNTGSVELTDVDISDPDATLSSCSRTRPATLQAGETLVCTATRTATLADLNAGEISNTASATGTASGPIALSATSETVSVPAVQSPDISLVKSGVPDPVDVDDTTITYTFLVENTGNVTLTGVTVTDPLSGLSAIDCTLSGAAFSGTLDPGETRTCTATYTVGLADRNRGYVTNSASVTSKDPNNADVTADSTLITLNVVQVPELTVTKTATETTFSAVGDTITYTISVANSGNVSLTGIDLVDALADPDTLVCGPSASPIAIPFSLDPGDSVDCTVTQTVDQTHLDAGSISNSVVVSATPPSGSLPPVSADDSVAANQTPELTVVKVSNTASFDEAGDSLAYTITVTNSGNVTLSSVSVTDAQITSSLACTRAGASVTLPVATLAPGASLVCTGTRTVTQGDVDAGSVKNTASASATDPNSDPVSGSSSEITTPAVENPELTTTKSSTTANYDAAGDTIDYTITVENTGNQTISDVDITDALLDGPVSNCTSASVAVTLPLTLAPGDSVTCEGVLTVTLDDLAAGSVSNIATATGSAPDSSTVSDDSPAVVVPALQSPELTLTKSAASGTFDEVGDTISYSFLLENTGNVALSAPFTVLDLKVGSVDCSSAPATLAPGATHTCTATYSVTQDDLDAGLVTNSATASASAPDGSSVVSPTSTVQTVMTQTPGLGLDKSASATSVSSAGLSITYTFDLENTGNVTLYGLFTVIDPKVGVVNCSGAATSLLPGGTTFCTASYVVTQADMDAGSIANTARAVGYDPDRRVVVTPTDSVTVNVAASPALSFEKSGPVAFGSAGAILPYYFVLLNSGNVTLSGPFTVADNLVNVTCPAVNALAPGSSLVCFGTHSASQADVDSGSLTNTASASAWFDGAEVTSAPDSTTALAVQDPALALQKSGTASFDSVGDTLSYEFRIENTGDTTLFGPWSVTDSLGVAIAIDCSAAAASLAPGEHTACTGVYTVTQADLDAGAVVNTADVEGFLPDATGAAAGSAVVASGDASHTSIGLERGSLTLTKRSTAATFTAVGETVTYEFDIENTGNVTMYAPFEVTDPNAGTVDCSGAPSLILVGSTATAACQVTYTITVSDIVRGYVENYAWVSGATPSNTTVTSGPAGEVVPAESNTGLTITKSSTSTAFSTVGEEIDYDFLLENTGDVALLAPFSVADPLVGVVDCTGAPASLAPAATFTCTASYRVRQSDLDSGSILNRAVATASGPGGTLVISAPDTHTINATQDPELTLEKTGPASFEAVGETVYFFFDVTNTGNVTMTRDGSWVSDPMVTSVACPSVASLAPGQSIRCSASYVITQADLDAGSITNSATATGKDPTGTPFTTAPSSALITGFQDPSLSVEKTGTAEFDEAGDVLTFSYTVTNTGDVTLFGTFTITDDRVLPADLVCSPPASLAPGASFTCAGTLTTDQPLMDAGSITNTVTVTGFAPDSDGTAADTTRPVSGSDSHTSQARQNPALRLEKLVTSADYAESGDTVEYSFEIINSGNVTLDAPFGIVDTGLDTLDCSLAPLTLAPGDSFFCTGTRAVVQEDVDRGYLENTATATGRFGSSDIESAPDIATAAADADTQLTLTKTGDVTSFDAVGDPIVFTFQLENTGTTTLTGPFTVVDPTIGVVDCTGAAATLAPQATTTCAATYAVTQADLDRGYVSNTARATAVDPDGLPISSPPSTEVVSADQQPNLSLDKVGPVSFEGVGETVYFFFDVANTGNVTIDRDGSWVSDAMFASVSCPPVTALAPGQSIRCSASYVTTQADLDAGSITNTATAAGKDPSGAGVSSLSSSVTVSGLQDESVSLSKTGTASFDAALDTILYGFEITNTGDVTLSGPYSVSDSLIPASDISCVDPAPDLAPGESTTCTASYSVSQLDLDVGSVVNTASVTAQLPDGSTVISPSDTFESFAEQNPDLSIVKSTTTDPAGLDGVGDVVTYTFTVTNTGNVSMSAVGITDDELDAPVSNCTINGSPSTAPITLAPGDVLECTGTHTLDQADLDAGSVTNTATVTGFDPNGNPASENSNTVEIAVVQAPSLGLQKTTSATGYSQPGDTLAYTFTLSNDGNVTLRAPYSVGDALVPNVDCTGAPSSLSPGGTATCTGSYTVTQQDVDDGEVANTAVAEAVGPGGSTVTSSPSTVTVNASQSPSISLDKIALDSTYAAVGQLVPYQFVVTNTGNTTLYGPIGIVDVLGVSVTCPPLASLAPNASTTCTAKYAVTQADLDAGSIVNSATVTMTDPDNNDVTDSDTDTSYATAGAELSLDKSGPGTFDATDVGSTITYSFAVTNTGSITLSGPFDVVDSLGITATCDPVTSLAPGQSLSCTADYTVTQTDLDRGSIVNSAYATAAPLAGGTTPVTSALSVWESTAVRNPGLALTKAGPATFSSNGETLAYTFELDNTGDVTVFGPFVVHDSLGIEVDCSGAPASLAPGASYTCTGSYVTTAADLLAGSIRNTAWAAALLPDSTGLGGATGDPIYTAVSVWTSQLLTGSVAGHIYEDVDGDGVLGAGDDPLEGVILYLYDSNGGLVASTVTDASGAYLFDPVVAGTYSLVEVQPTGYLDGLDVAGVPVNGTLSGDDTIAGIVLTATSDLVGYDFRELRTVEVSGQVFQDNDGNGTIGAGESGIAKVRVELAGTDFRNNVVNRFVFTDQDGRFLFDGLLPGDYTLTEIQPAAYLDGDDTPGTGGAVAVADDTFEVTLLSGQSSLGNLFAENGSSLSGRVYLDRDRDGVDDGLVLEEGIEDVLVSLQGMDADGNSLLVSTRTDVDGWFSFDNIPGGQYSLIEAQPSAYRDGPETAGTGGGLTTINDVIAPVVIAAGADVSGYRFAEWRGLVGGVVFSDVDADGVQDLGERGIPGVRIDLTGSDRNGDPVSLSVNTDAAGVFLFSDLLPPDADGYTLTEPVQPAAYLDGVETAGSGGGVVVPPNGDEITDIFPGTSDATGYLFAEIPGSLSGAVWVDLDDNGLIGVGEGIADVLVTLTGTDGTIRTAMSTADGSYTILDVPAGSYTLTEVQPTAYGDGPEAIGTAGGASAPSDTVTGITMTAGAAAAGYNFEERLASVAGRVYEDLNANGRHDTGEPGIASVALTLNGSDSLGRAVPARTVYTDSDGGYVFVNLFAGVYTVVESHPAGYVDGGDQAGAPANGTVAPPDTITAITVPVGGELVGYDFGELVGSIAGRVYRDLDSDGSWDAGEPGIPNVTVTLTGTVSSAPITPIQVITDANGLYRFDGLRAGTYAVTETQPPGYADWLDAAGTAGGTVANDTVTGIVLTVGQRATGYDFGEILLASISGKVFDDRNRNGARSATEPGIPSVTLRLSGTDLQGNAVSTTTTTDANGDYSFIGLAPGTYTVEELAQPSGYADGLETAGSAAGDLSIDDRIQRIVLVAGQTATGYLFAELSSSISGAVYADSNGNGVRDAGDTAIAGVLIQLTGLDLDGDPVSRSALTDAAGAFSILGLREGIYSLHEVQPTGYLDWLDAAGSAGGSAAAPDADDITGAVLGAGVVATGYLFSEVRAASLAGSVYVDANSNGVRDLGEAGISSAVVALGGTDASGRSITTLFATTDPLGNYLFQNLLPGTYTVEEVQPVGYRDGKDTAGSRGGLVVGPDSVIQIVIRPSDSATGYVFGEAVPVSLSGFAYVDRDDDGTKAVTEVGLADVQMILSGVDFQGVVVYLVTDTAADGSYSFTGLSPSNSAGYSVSQSQPDGFADGKERAGSRGGVLAPPNSITSIRLDSGDTATGYLFGERQSSLRGYVWNDLDGDGLREVGEPGILGVTVTLTGIDRLGDPVSRTATTDATGRYLFNDVPAGSYTVAETQPAGFLDGADLVGSAGGVLAPPDAVASVELSGSTAEFGYDFGEVVASTVSGLVFEDIDGDLVRDLGEPGIEGVTVRLLGRDAQGRTVELTSLSNASGQYEFTGLAPSGIGGYRIVEDQPVGYGDGPEQPGSGGGVASPTDSIVSIQVLPSQALTGYLFTELRGSISGSVYVDADGDGERDTGEVGIAGAVINLSGTAVGGAPVSAAATTGADGRYEFLRLAPGTYSVSQASQPLGYIDWKEHVGTAGGDASTNDEIQSIALVGSTAATGYDFGEVASGQITGTVYLDFDLDGQLDPGETGLGGVTVTLTGTDALGQPVGPVVATTAGSGAFTYVGLAPGTYRLTQTQPSLYANCCQSSGSVPADTGEPNVVKNLVLGSGTVASGVLFGERAGSVSGVVYEDRNADGSQQPDEPGIPDVLLLIEGLDREGNDVYREVRTDSRGRYTFFGLPAGTFSVLEVQPSGYADWVDGIGSSGGTFGGPSAPSRRNIAVIASSGSDVVQQIVIEPGEQSSGYTFSEVTPGSITGSVYLEITGDSVLGEGDLPMSGYKVILRGIDRAGRVVGPLVTFTDANGGFRFDDLGPGTYEIERSPADQFADSDSYLDGPVTTGTGGGLLVPPRTVRSIELELGSDLTGYVFRLLPGTLPPTL